MIRVPYISHLAAALTRNKWGWVLSVTNLIITIAAFFAILVYVNWDLSHNRVWPDSHLIYRVASLDIPKSGPVSKNLLFPESQVSVLSNFIGDQASDLTAVGAMQATATINERDVVVPLQFVNQNFLDFFQLDTTQGDLDFALSTPGYIALEESMAKELFGSSSLAQINEPITLMGSSSLSIVDGVPTMLPGREVAFTVGAIYKLPSPITSATKFFALTLMHDFSQSLSAPASGTPFSLVSIWMKIDSPKDARQVENSLAGITGVSAGFSGEAQLFLEPLRDIYFQNRGDITTESPAGDITRTTAIAIIGMMILVSGCSNTMSASMTDSLKQLRSTGVRRAFGGTRQHVFTLRALQHK